MALIDFVAKQLQAVLVGDVLDHDGGPTIPKNVRVGYVVRTAGV